MDPASLFLQWEGIVGKLKRNDELKFLNKVVEGQGINSTERETLRKACISPLHKTS
jgi:hypothetical protein